MKAEGKCPDVFQNPHSHSQAAPQPLSARFRVDILEPLFIFLRNPEDSNAMCALSFRHFQKDGFKCHSLDFGGKSEDKRGIRNCGMGEDGDLKTKLGLRLRG